jgi:osmotically-inducible protein OsmY
MGTASSTTAAEGSNASGLPQSDVNASTADASNLKSQIEGALQKEPTLSNDKIIVNVTDTTVELTGTAVTGKDKQTAKRIAQSYAGNRRLVDHITVSGRGTSPSDQSTPR